MKVKNVVRKSLVAMVGVGSLAAGGVAFAGPAAAEGVRVTEASDVETRALPSCLNTKVKLVYATVGNDCLKRYTVRFVDGWGQKTGCKEVLPGDAVNFSLNGMGLYELKAVLC